jgi:hypothetical protein
MPKQRLSPFRYNYRKGPRHEFEIEDEIQEGNCRLALQDYFLVFNGKIFAAPELLNPEAYLYTGIFIKNGFSEDFFDGLDTGTVIYAERFKNKNGGHAIVKCDSYLDTEKYLISLHSAIYIAAVNDGVLKRLPAGISYPGTGPAIWHATVIEGETCLWPLAKFLLYYKPVAAKSFVLSGSAPIPAQ